MTFIIPLSLSPIQLGDTRLFLRQRKSAESERVTPKKNGGDPHILISDEQGRFYLENIRYHHEVNNYAKRKVISGKKDRV